MHPIAIERTIAYGDVKVVVASDPDERIFIGVGLGQGQRGNLVFIQVDPDTTFQLENGEVDLFTVIRHRGTGLVFEAPRMALAPQPSHA
ncbi:hypothetical protein [Ideonella sp. BN130291]|uniref:hypothetical protein n=1 Tax=Ideonella sp. BN130291 TaxID=3112940 RepID=UPI002E25D78E|nr:hypothetical protein [Ideonella sp. BN130291]